MEAQSCWNKNQKTTEKIQSNKKKKNKPIHNSYFGLRTRKKMEFPVG